MNNCLTISRFPIAKYVQGDEIKDLYVTIASKRWQESFCFHLIRKQLKLFSPDLYQFQVASSETRDIWLAIKLALLLLDA